MAHPHRQSNWPRVAQGIAAAWIAIALPAGGAPPVTADEVTRTELPSTDRLIVRLRPEAAGAAKAAGPREALAIRLSVATGRPLKSLRVMGDGSQVMQMGRRATAAEIEMFASRMRLDPEVLEVYPDRLFFPAATPNDPQYASQWYLGATSGINAPPAWDITTGDPNLVIAIVDTGKLPHEELASRWVGGYDFVSLAPRDADATPGTRDADASDPGDWVTPTEAATIPGCTTTDSRWHGTLMAGAIGANANNGAGIAGVNWNSKLLPVRVVGKCGGYESDIADGIRWAAGLSVPGVPANANPAKVLNVSLSASGGCSAPLQGAINDVLAAGAPVVVAAGNNSVAASGYSPANCAGVISVGSVDRNGGKASYTNFGSPTVPLTVSAPGGKAASDFAAADTTDNQWVLTTSNPGLTGPSANNAYYAKVFGTSISTAQVTGVASLVLSAMPSLQPQDVSDIVRNTSRSFPTGTTALAAPSQADCTADLCGLGIVDAEAAVKAAGQWGNTAPRLSAGGGGSLFVRTDGIVLDWGRFYLSALADMPTPTPVASFKGMVKVSRSYTHALAVRADGTAWGWAGYGIGTGNLISTPHQIAGLAGVVAAAAGGSYSLFLKRDGTVWGLGRNNEGQLGDGTTTDRNAPVKVPELAGVVAIAASNTHTQNFAQLPEGGLVQADRSRSYALKGDGTVWAWGTGLLGTGSLAPVQQSGIAGATAIAAGESHLLVLKADGTVWALGKNGSGQLGNGTNADSTALVPVSNLAGVMAIGAGSAFSLALKSDGTVWAWGENAAGQLGDGTTTNRNVPVQVAGLGNVSAIAAGASSGLALKSDGSVWQWGSSPTGPVPLSRVPGIGGLGDLWLAATLTDFVAQAAAPIGSVRVSNPITVTGIATGASINVSGGSYSIGCNGVFTSSPGTINPGQTVCVSQNASPNCNASTLATLTIAGFPAKPFSVATVPCDLVPDLFTFDTQANVTPGATVVSNVTSITGINGPAPVSIAGGEYAIGFACNGGFTSSPGTIGNGEFLCVRQVAPATADTARTVVLTVGGVTATFSVITAVSPSFNAPPRIWKSLALRSDGTLFALVNAPVQETSVSGVVQASGSFQDILVVRSDATIWAKGNNAAGRLGDGTTRYRSTAAPVPGLSGVTQSASGSTHSLARKADGTLWAWGGNAQGQLGDGTTVDRLTPVQIPLTGVVAVATDGGATSFAVKSDGTVWSWGSGRWANSATPTALAGVAGAIAIAVGSDHLIFLKGDGTAGSIGANLFGQLGNGNNTDSSTPVPVANLAGVTAVAADYNVSMALKSDGTVWAWGWNSSGQLGDGTTTNRNTPVQVLGLSGVSAIAPQLALVSDGSVWTWGYATPLSRVRGVGGSGYLWLAATLDQFVPVSDAPFGSLQASNPIVVSGIANGAAIGVTGGEYSIGCTESFTAISGTINAGQKVCVRQTASSSCGGTTVATLTISGLAAKTFAVTAVNTCDWTPDPFSFPGKADVPPGATVDSSIAWIRGIDSAAPISIVGGLYSIGAGCSGPFTASAGTISNEQFVCVRVTAPAAPNAFVTAVLTVGTASVPFTVFTAAAPSFTTPARISASLGVRSDGALFRIGSPPARIDTINAVVQASTFGGSTLVLRGDGTVWSTEPNRPEWARLPSLDGAVAVTEGGRYRFAIRGDGTLWGWGSNSYGQIGDGTTVDRPVPVPAQMTGVSAVASASFFDPILVFIYEAVYALKTDGTVWAWGLGPLRSGSTPAPLAGIGGATAIAAGTRHLIVLKGDGTVWAAGENADGQLGNGANTRTYTFVQVANLGGVVAIAAAGTSNWALRGDGTVWAWGGNAQGQLAEGTTLNRNIPVQVPGLGGISAIAPGLAFRPDGSVWTLSSAYGLAHLPTQVEGVDGDGTLLLQLDNTRPNPFVFIPVIGAGLGSAVASNAITVRGLGTVASPITVTGGQYSVNGGAFGTAAGTVVNGDRVVARTTSAAAYSTLTSTTVTIGGASGQSSTFLVRTRDDLAQAGGVPRVAAGDSHTYLLAPSGFVYAAGYNGNGQLGNGSTLGSSVLRPVSGLADVASIASGAFHGLALKKDGTVATWGSNAAGQLGHGSVNPHELYPLVVPGLADVSAVSAGRLHSVALKAGGTVWTWGLNTQGQLGDGTAATSRSTPVQVAGLGNVTAVAAGGRHTLALLFDGTVRAWGANENGQLGDNSTFDRGNPVVVSGLANVVAIAAGDAHSLALKSDGTVVAWGFNAFGQLGVGSTANSKVPLPVTSLGGGVGLIAAGSNHSLAVKSGGAIHTWGNNANSQLGNGNNANQLVPVQLAAPAGVTSVSGGARHTAAITVERRLYLFGDNYFGQVGNRSGNYSPQSASLNVLRGDSVISTGASGTGSGVGIGSNSGSSVIEIDGQATGFDFGSRATGGSAQTPGRYRNASPTEDITDVGVGVSGAGFSIASGNCPATLTPDQECMFSIAFNPATAGSYQGELVIASSVAGSPERRALFGTAVAPASPAIAYARTGLDVPPQTVGTPSAPYVFSLTNTGSATLGVTGVSSTLADFIVTHDCGAVAPGAGCALSVVFNPAGVGLRSAYLTIASNAGGAIPPIAVSGTGAPNGTAVTALAGRLVNISTRMQVLTGNDVLIGGFIIGGTQAKTVVVRARGPSLTAQGVPGAMANPVLQLFSGPTQIAANDNWKEEAVNANALTASGFAPANDFESAIHATLGPGGYTAIVTGAGGTTGVGIVEVFEVDKPEAPLINIATRGRVLTGADVMIGGFIIQGDGPQTVIVRARGPSLAAAGVPGVLANPFLQLFAGATQIAVNDNWQDGPDAATIQSTGFAPASVFESAIRVTLNPGAYTAIVTGVGGTTGVAIIEVFAQ